MNVRFWLWVISNLALIHRYVIRDSVRSPMGGLFDSLAQQYGDVIEINEFGTAKLCQHLWIHYAEKGFK